MEVLWDTKVEAQCGSWLPPHPQRREDWGSGVPENSIWWWSRSYVGAVGRRTSFGRRGLLPQRGRLSGSPCGRGSGRWWLAGTHCPSPPSLHLPLLSQLRRVDVSHSDRYVHAFPDERYCTIEYHHLHHNCISVCWWFCQSQLLRCGFLMTSHSLRKNCTEGVYLLLRLENKDCQTVRPAKEWGN